MLTLTKDQVWEQVFNVVARTTDGMGRPIDTGIMGVILGLNAHGMHTTMSCEGHLDHGLPYPWVWVPVEDQSELTNMLTAFNHENPEEGYEAMDRMLIILCSFIEDMCMLQSFGACCQNEREPKLKAKKLKAYQQEMQAFAIFLKERFFDE